MRIEPLAAWLAALEVVFLPTAFDRFGVARGNESMKLVPIRAPAFVPLGNVSVAFQRLSPREQRIQQAAWKRQAGNRDRSNYSPNWTSPRSLSRSLSPRSLSLDIKDILSYLVPSSKKQVFAWLEYW